MTDSAWQSIRTAPRDGTRILVAVYESEQGPAEVDVVRWANPGQAHEKAWVAADSQPNVPVTYSEGEIVGWMPMPAPPAAAARTRRGEIDGSSI